MSTNPVIKILHVIKSLGRGGAEVLLPETLKLHDKTRFEFHYIYFLPSNDMAPEIEKSGGVVSRLPADGNIRIMLQGEKIIDYCKKYKIDIMHCHLPLAGFVGRYVFTRTKIPLIYTEHNIQEKYHFATKIFNKYTYNAQSIAIGVSKDVTRSIQDNIDPGIPVETILNGVNTEFFKRDDKKGNYIKSILKIPDDALVVGNIAVFREQKSLPDWVRAFEKISRSNSNIYGILVGTGPEEEEIKKLISELKLTEKLKLPGLQVDTVSYFSAMDVFMLSSAFEGLPIALLEAMSMECAVVSTKAGGVVEAVRDGQEGFLCEIGDWKSLAEKTILLLENETKREDFQSSCRARVKEVFSLKVMVEELEKIYTQTSRIR